MMILATLLLAAAPPSGMPDLRAADARLNAQYRATMAEMRRRDAAPQRDATTGPSYAQALLDAQRKWIAFRDANCLSVAYEYRGGSAERLSRGTCLVSMTDARTRELRQIQRGASPD